VEVGQERGIGQLPLQSRIGARSHRNRSERTAGAEIGGTADRVCAEKLFR